MPSAPKALIVVRPCSEEAIWENTGDLAAASSLLTGLPKIANVCRGGSV